MDAADRVRAAVDSSDGTTRAALAAELGLPLGTVTAAVSALLRAGLLEERPDPARRAALAGGRGGGAHGRTAGAGRAGRPPMLLVSTGPVRTVGAVIWTHGRLQTAVATYGGTILARGDIEVAGDTSSPDVLEPAWDFLVRRSGDAAWDRVVVGVPAPFQSGVGMPPGRLPVPEAPNAVPQRIDAHFAPWLRPDPASALEARLGVPVLIENDANLGALGEAHAGAGRGRRCLIYLKVGERSFGAGLVLDGELYRGISGFAGELAHIHTDDDGPLCSCGARGCLAARARGPLLELMRHAYDRPLTFAEVLRLAEAGEPAPVRVLRELGRTLGRPLADVCTFLDPGALVLDAALGAAGRHVLAGLAEQIERYCAPAVAASLVLLPGELGADADIHGAIRLARAAARAETVPAACARPR